MENADLFMIILGMFCIVFMLLAWLVAWLVYKYGGPIDNPETKQDFWNSVNERSNR